MKKRKKIQINNYVKVSINKLFIEKHFSIIELNSIDEFNHFDKLALNNYKNLLIKDGYKNSEIAIIFNSLIKELLSLKGDDKRYIETIENVNLECEQIFYKMKGMSLEQGLQDELYEDTMNLQDEDIEDDEANIMRALRTGNGDLYGF